MAVRGSLGGSNDKCMHFFHPTPFCIEVLNLYFQIIILKNKMAICPNHVKSLQMTSSGGLKPPIQIKTIMSKFDITVSMCNHSFNANPGD